MAENNDRCYISDKDEPNLQIATSGTEEHEPEVDVRCGYGSCKPEVLQRCNNPKMLLLIICIFTVFQGFVARGISNVNVSSIERRFQLSSSKTSLLSSSYEFAAAVFGIILSFFASGRYKGRWITVSAVAVMIGSFTMALPHFTTGLYEWGQDVSKTCDINGTVVADDGCEDSGLHHYLGLLMVGMMLAGVGGAILFTVGITYLDDSVTSTESPFYLGCMYGSSALGPGFGYIVGGQLLNVYVDFDKVDTNTITLETDDPRWVGAWWAGFFIAMATCLLVAIPLSCFGAEMPSAKTIRENRESQMHKGDTKSHTSQAVNGKLPIRQMPRIMWLLLSNPSYLFNVLAGASEGILTTGIGTFIPKYIQNRFGVSAGAAGLYAGLAVVPGAAGGMFFGGFLCNKLKLKVQGMLKFAIIVSILAIMLSPMMWISCDEGSFAGINHPYKAGGPVRSLHDACNSNCSCSTRYYEPVCSDNDVQYFSACFAGCRQTSDDGKMVTDCACLPVADNATTSGVTPGGCRSECGLMYLLLVLLFVFIFVNFLPTTPSESARLRCIHEDHRTFSMGIKWCVVRLLGTVPGPVIFGAVTDTSCIVWQTQCGENTSCWLYDNGAVSRNYFLLIASSKLLATIFYLLALCLYKPPASRDSRTFDQRGSAKRHMSFVNASFKAPEYEESVLPESETRPTDEDKVTRL